MRPFLAGTVRIDARSAPPSLAPAGNGGTV